MKLRGLLLALVGGALLMADGGLQAEAPDFAGPPLPYFIDESALPFDSLPGTSTTTLWGVHGGAAFRIEVPDAWNGDLVLHAHGFRGTCEPSGAGACELTVDDPPIRRLLVEGGYAWAASSYATNGYDVKQGVKDTHALAVRFSGLVGNPRRVYLMGFSMGGHITAVSIEQYPRFYSGAMPMCGVLGDTELFDFFTDFNLVALTLAGLEDQFPVPPGVDYQTDLVPQIKAALGPAYPVLLNTQGMQLVAATELLSGGVRPAFAHAYYFWNAIAGDFLFGLFASGDGGSIGVAPGSVIENSDTVYQLDTDPALSPEEADLNARVPRVEQDPQGRHPDGLAHIPPVLGNIRVPVLSLHTLGDLFVTFGMEQVYAQRVAANGASGLLVSRAIRDVGHCWFAPSEIAAGFVDLVEWVESGVRPAGDDILDPAAVADPNFGCAFTLAESFPERLGANPLFQALPGSPFPIPACP